MTKAKDGQMPEGYFSESPSRVFRPGVKPPVQVDARLSAAEVENVLARKRIAARLDEIDRVSCRLCGMIRSSREMRKRPDGNWECRSARKCLGI